MPRSRRRRVNDRRREADQRRIAAEALRKSSQVEKVNRDRYVRSVFKARAGEVVEGHDGREYVVREDGGLDPRGGTS